MIIFSLNYQECMRIETRVMLDVNIKVITRELRWPTSSPVNVKRTEWKDDTFQNT